MRRAKRQAPAREPVLRWAGLTTPRAGALAAALALVVLSGLAVVRTTHESRSAFGELQRLRERANALEIEGNRLLLERSTFAAGGRIESRAREELGMRVPEAEDIVVVDLRTEHERR